MRILVVYSSRAGSTAQIAERIAQRLNARGHDADVESITDASDAAGYDAFVVGSAVYIGHWEKEAVDFVHRGEAVLGERPTWLFSSGPLGAEQADAEGRDKREVAVPEEIASFTDALHPRGHRVFFGALDPDHLGLGPRLMRLLPAGRKLLEAGDFRDWGEIEAWADSIAAELAARRTPAGAAI